jgi:hypothetical protein
MSVVKATQATVRFFEEVLKKTAHVVEMDYAEDKNGWWALVEAIEESAYMRKYARGDTVGLYEVNLDEDFQVTSYSRRGLKERTAVTSHVA